MTARLLIIGMVLLLAMPRMGTAGNGIMEFEVPFETTLYVPCLNEDVHINLLATVRTHLVSSGNGGEHYVENWFIEGTAEGLSSGYNWFGHGASPFVVNAGAAEVTKLLANLTYEPLDGGQKFVERLSFQFVADAHGNPRKLEEFQKFKCIAS